MKNLILILALTLHCSLFTLHSFSQSYNPPEIIFNTQAQVDSFQINYPNYTEIEGDVAISYMEITDITNLDGLNVLTSIGGNLSIGSFYLNAIPGGLGCWGNPLLEDITGLNNLTNIDGDLNIYCNEALTNLSGLESLTTIGGSLQIGYVLVDITGPQLAGNPSLIDISALESLSSINGDVQIEGNSSLTSLAGLDNIESGSIENISIRFNSSLVACEAQSICDYLSDPTGTVDIYYNATACNNPFEIANACGFQIPCLPFGNYHFKSQNEVDSFQVRYPDCIDLQGNVTIGGSEVSDIANLNGLSAINSIGGDLLIAMNESLTSLAGLTGLQTIGGGLHIGNSGYYFGNPSLISLSGLEGLTSIGGELEIAGNGALTSLSGLDNIDAGSISDLSIYGNNLLSTCEIQSICDYLVSPNGYVGIGNNSPGCNSEEQVLAICGNTAYLPEGITFSNQEQIDSFQMNYPACQIILGDVKIQGDDIENLNGLNDLISCWEDLEILNNVSLVNLSGLDSLISVGNRLSIYGNEILTNFMGLNNLTSINGDLVIQSNDHLTSLIGLDNLISLNGNLSIRNNYALTSLTGLDNLTSIEGNLTINNNDIQTSLTGLDKLASIGGDIKIEDNKALTSLTGLESLNDIGNLLMIKNNSELISLSGIENINPLSIVNLGIINNESLSTCHVQSICDYLAAPGGTVGIGNNAPGCNSQEEIEAECAQSVNELPLINNLSISPNPCSGVAHLELVISDRQLVICELLTISGNKVKELMNEEKLPGTYEMELDLWDLPAGVYYCVLRTGEGFYTTKLIKL